MPERIKAYRKTDNKTADLSDWNYDLLPIELAELQGMNYDLGLLGFNQDELAELLDPGDSERKNLVFTVFNAGVIVTRARVIDRHS